MPRVIISSGHTAASPGVIANGLNEYEVARKIAKNALKYIRQNGIISLSVPPNMELAQRIQWINNTGYMRETNDIAIEVHINDSDGTKRGLEAWYEGNGGNPSHALATQIVTTLSLETGLIDVGAKSEFTHELGSIAFVHELSPHSMIVEVGYIDNEEDAKFLKEEHNLDLCGRGIAKGILNYYGLEYRELQIPSPVVQPAPTPQLQVEQAQPDYFTMPTPPAPAAPISTPITQPVPTPIINNVTPIATTPTPTIRAQSDDYDEDFDDYNDDFVDFSALGNSSAVASVTPAPASPTPITTGPTIPNLNNYANPVAATPPPQPYSNNTFGNTYGGGVNSGLEQTTSLGSSTTMPMLSREERKTIITKNYTKILGREPNQNDLNYFLNVGIREDELIKKMVDSQEHADLVKSRQEVITMKKQFTDQQAELNELRSNNEDHKAILDQVQSSVKQKNIALANLQNELKELQQKLNEQPITKTTSVHKKYKGTFSDKLFKAFSDLFE